jgi:hypothetical protein
MSTCEVKNLFLLPNDLLFSRVAGRHEIRNYSCWLSCVAYTNLTKQPLIKEPRPYRNIVHVSW